ncbi:unnamed protein product [marine sediment metagenome]|uniref:Uncharacterized protein n=1 Tax=marine sediment metagenome TaxID=412755 RepID=X1M6B0_9ZZZZ
MRQLSFITDGAAKSGTATEKLTGLAYAQFMHGIAITDIFQTTSGTLANDADWSLYVDGKLTEYSWSAEELDPASIGRAKPSSPLTVTPGVKIQFKWAGQTAAAANELKIYFEPIR